jgi:hypothetical protein
VDEPIREARERMAEQLQSDERLLGVLPEAATELVLDHALARLDAAAAHAPDVDGLSAAFDEIRGDARALVDEAAAAADPVAAVQARIAPAAPDAEVMTGAGGTAVAAVAVPAESPVMPEAVALPPDAQRGLSLWDRIRDALGGFGRRDE